MADQAVLKGPKILLVAALESTLEPTMQLIRESAEALQKSVQIKPLVVAGAWAYFEKSNLTTYLNLISEQVRQAAVDVDVVVLSQASMALAVEALQDLKCEVLSSPKLGVASAIDCINDLYRTSQV